MAWLPQGHRGVEGHNACPNEIGLGLPLLPGPSTGGMFHLFHINEGLGVHGFHQKPHGEFSKGKLKP